MSASTAGRPLRCQFAGAADIERADLGKTFDPNHDEPATIADLAVTSWRTMGSPRLTALGIGCATIRIPGSPPGRSKTSEKIRSPELRPDIYSDGDRRAMLEPGRRLRRECPGPADTSGGGPRGSSDSCRIGSVSAACSRFDECPRTDGDTADQVRYEVTGRVVVPPTLVGMKDGASVLPPQG